MMLLPVFVVSCLRDFDSINRVSLIGAGTTQVTVTVQKPARLDELDFTLLTLFLTNSRRGLTHEARFNANGEVTIDVEPGTYLARVTGQFHDDVVDDTVYIIGGIPDFLLLSDGIMLTNGTIIPPTRNVRLTAIGGEPDIPLVIREFYWGGDFSVMPGGTYANDAYIEIYNNSMINRDVVLDSLFFGAITPHNSSISRNPWLGLDTIAKTAGQFMIPPRRDGQPRILRPGESIVIAIQNAMDLRGITRNALRLDRAHFTTWQLDYTNRTTAPDVERLRRMTNEGFPGGNAYAFSVSSPAVVIYRIPNWPEYYADVDGIWEKVEPEGDVSGRRFRHICASWIIDGVETFSAASGTKRLPSTVDISHAYLREGRLRGTAIRRKVKRVLDCGHVVYLDTNNSANDFETDVQPNPRLRN
jgi:hypothetical protein